MEGEREGGGWREGGGDRERERYIYFVFKEVLFDVMVNREREKGEDGGRKRDRTV